MMQTKNNWAKGWALSNYELMVGVDSWIVVHNGISSFNTESVIQISQNNLDVDGIEGL